MWRRLGRTQVTVGQMKPPFGRERFTADTELALIDRTPATDHLVPNGNLGRSFVRDYGVEWDWHREAFSYSLGVFGGSGANSNPHRIAPLVAGRLSYDLKSAPPSRQAAVHAEMALAWREAHDLDFTSQLPGSKPLGYGQFDGQDWRLDLAAGLKSPRREMRAEYLRAQFRPSGPATPSITAEGYYVQGSYRLTESWEAAARYDAFDPHQGAADGHNTHQTTLGVNLYLHGNREKVQANYLFGTADSVVCQYQRFF